MMAQVVYRPQPATNQVDFAADQEAQPLQFQSTTAADLRPPAPFPTRESIVHALCE